MSLQVFQSYCYEADALVYWPATEPKGGIVCLHGSEGGSIMVHHIQAALFAANGFAAMAKSYTENDPEYYTRPDIIDVPLDVVEQALLEMKKLMAEYGCGAGLFGHSRGAELSLLLAQLLAEDQSPALPDAIAVHAVQDVIHGAYIVDNHRYGKEYNIETAHPAWLWRGSSKRTRPGLALKPELFPNPIFIAHGVEDELWDVEFARCLVSRLETAGHAVEAHFFEDEGHTFGPGRNRELELVLDFFSRHLMKAMSP
ncbi:alpha/beta hydrolase family protein [Oryzifoliimicrobium ureilyticus]|uniref:alpha/beta hydrolase family protein n=1 Tax=Oryzifoliimicrobium ureilyticus TaxID=3113724 RepID=UPI00307616D5